MSAFRFEPRRLKDRGPGDLTIHSSSSFTNLQRQNMHAVVIPSSMQVLHCEHTHGLEIAQAAPTENWQKGERTI